MDTVLKQEIILKYNKAVKLENQKKKDDELLKMIPYESEKIIDEYQKKYNEFLQNKDNEIHELQKQIEELKEKRDSQNEILMKIPQYIRKFYRV